MSQPNRKYKRLEALLSESKPVDPDPAARPGRGDVDSLKARVSELEARLAAQQGAAEGSTARQTSKSVSQKQKQAGAQGGPMARKAPEEDSGVEAANESILKKIQRFFSAPVFISDVEKTRSAKLLYQIIKVVWGLPALLLLVIATNPAQRASAIPPLIVISLTLLALMFISRRGWVRLANYIIVGMIILTVSYADFSNTGNIQPSTLVVAIAIIMSGLLLGRRAPIVAALLIAASHAIIVYLQIRGRIQMTSAPASATENMIITGVILLLIGSLFQFVITRLQLALDQSRQDERELQVANRELQALSTSLELRVADRTHDLELAAEVGRAVTEKVSNVYAMLSEATELIRSRFGLYYTQVYLLDPSGHTLSLRAGTGEVGQQLLRGGHRLLVNPLSLNGRAVSEKKSIIVSDTSENTAFLPNPLLPNTRSEMVVPLIVSGRVLGVLDMQSEAPDALNLSNLPAFETLAGQLSIAIQNAALFTQSEEARKQVEANVRQITGAGWQDFLNAIERGEKIGYSFDQVEVTPMEKLNALNSVQALSVPIMVTGANVGTIQFVEQARNWTTSEMELVQATAAQLAQHIDNLRLLAQAEYYRSDAEQAVRRLTREGWEDFVQTRSDLISGFTYDLNSVQPLDGGDQQGHFASAVTKQFVVRNQPVGELAVGIGDKSPEEINDIITAVAEQLGAQIENLRLSEQNELRSAELEKVVSQLRELDRLKSSFLANMSHELRTPLNSILGFADVMLEELDGPLTDNMNNDLGLIQKNGQHLLHLINDVLDMAKIESGKMNLNPESFKVHEIFEDVTSITAVQAVEKKLELKIANDSDRNLEIFADRTRLRQVMINIVNNAIKFTEHGSVSIRATRVEDERVLISIKDTGIGIPPDKLEAVFQEFTQVDVSSTRKSGGTGLGLPISRRLVDLHGGRIWAESTGISGEGCTFFVEVPIQAKIVEPIEKQEK